MQAEQIPRLIAAIALADPRVQRQDRDERRAQVSMWAGILADVPYEYALEAAQRHYAQSKWPILPADIATVWRDEVRARMARHTDPTPDADPDNPQLWTAELRATRAAVATGQLPPAPLRELTAGTRDEREQQAASVLAGIGFVPRAVRDQVAPRTRTVLRGQQVDGPARLPRNAALAVDCPRANCRAQRNQLCTRPSGREMHAHVHDQRKAAYATALAAQELS
jgi:hypothetical protein